MVIEDAVFDNLEWKEVDGEELHNIVAGMTVAGAEPIDYPATDGMILYFRSPAGDLIAVDISSDPYTQEFYILMAQVPGRGSADLQEPEAGQRTGSATHKIA